MEKLELRKVYKDLYQPSAKKVVLVEVPSLQFAMVDGSIEAGESPGTSPAFQQAMEVLYGISYTLKFASKQRKVDPVDYPVMPLEGLWWVEQGEFDIKNPGNWCWMVMIMQPDHITLEMFQEARSQLQRKRPALELDTLRFERFHEGTCLQIMHIGPYAEEPATLAKMDAFAQEQGYRMRGKHHEIYLGDPRHAVPARLKTVLRHPVEKY
jgi:hypothetical protein